MEQCQATTDGGVFGSIEKVLGVAGKVSDFVEKLSKGDALGIISGGVDLAKTGCEIAGISTDGTTTGYNGYKGDVHFNMSGSIGTTGQSKKGAIFDEMPAANLKIGSFDFKNNTFGQGVWNLETAPVVYCSNVEVNWKSQLETYKFRWYYVD